MPCRILLKKVIARGDPRRNYYSPIRVNILYRIIGLKFAIASLPDARIVVQMHVHCIENATHTRQVLVVFLCLIVCRRQRDILSQRRIRTQPAAGSGVQVACSPHGPLT